ncbi:hypothetical protein rsdtw13_17060 [Clostridium sp. TW13]|uniref:Uncharacterized protein n=1 Tax=Inconstantimicrobium mannanitabidum TaxID=1604901 RepID=A0ACB5RBQ3_9CLOT|nr:hypothetical protein rsdtw13_17060 [Clostridium sp. TW13]
MNVNNFFSLLLLVSAFTLLYLGYFSWKRNKRYVSISLLPVLIYAFGYSFEILCTSLAKVKFWIKVEYLGISFLPVVWLIFALNFTGYKEKLKKSTLILLYIIPATTLILNYTNDFHHLFYKKLTMNNTGIFPIVEIVKGPWYWVNIGYTYSIMLIGLIVLMLAYSKAVSIIKKQLLFIIVAWIIPWISDIVYMLGFINFHIDLCPLTFSISGIISSFAILRFRLLKLTPIALEKVFSNMLDGVIILDSENNIVDFNNSSKGIISELNHLESCGKKIDEVLMENKEVLNAINSPSCNESLISIRNKDELKYYKMNINNIYEKNDAAIGKILILNDVSEEKKNEEKISKLLKLKEAMLKISYSFNEISNINDFLQFILDEVINCIDERICGSILFLGQDKNLKIVASKGYDLEKIKAFTLKLENHFAWESSGENITKTVIINDLDKMESISILDTVEGEKIKSCTSSPIIIDGELYGFLNIDSIYNNYFSEGDLELMEYMSNQVSIAIAKHKLYEEIIYLSRYDKLTNVYNRSSFQNIVDNIYNDDSSKKDFVLAVMDVNDLKIINDNYGHLAGDELIKRFAKGLKGLAKDADIIGRFGGDEFVGVFFNIDVQNLTNRFEELIKLFKKNPIIFEDYKFVCSYSYGLANSATDGIKFDQLIKIADKRMYKYKNIVKSKKVLTNSNV